ncbi:MAG: HAD family hydrolase [Lachnospiraceae bacterium]|nr:HAD family hydrolase [Lachnospiraceae bacterium]
MERRRQGGSVKKGIIFDMDGTVWDSSDNIAASWNEKITEAGYAGHMLTAADFKRVMGKPMDVIADILFTFTEKGPERNALRNACEKYETVYLRKHGGMLYEGITDTWQKLKDMGYHNYIVSNCQSGYIEAFLGFYGISQGSADDLIEDIECYGNNLRLKDENIRLIAERNGLDIACYVGDIQGDYDATVMAGYPFIHARYGFGQIDAEVPYIDSFPELIKVIPEVIG